MATWQQLAQEKRHWTAASDEKVLTTQLFVLLEAFADRVIERARTVKAELANLQNNTIAASVQLNCTFNTLANLSSSQFVANVCES